LKLTVGKDFPWMRKIDMTFEIAGSSGDGTLASGDIFANTLSDIGYHILSFDVYPAEIRGFGKCVAHTRISDKPVSGVGRNVDILLSLNDPYGIEQLKTLKPTGVVIFDSKPVRELNEHECIAGHLGPGMFLYGIPFGDLSQQSTQSSRSRNIIALGALSALFDIDMEVFIQSLHRKFKKKKGLDNIIESAFRCGFEYVKDSILKVDPYSLKTQKILDKKNYKIFTGTQVVAQGAIDANCRFYAGYPITPATKIMEILSAKLPALGGNVVQTEDEISAIGMVTGAAFVGTRAMTATSGPGLSLMTEFIGYNIKIENPVVIIDGQRGGPATGLPTKTEQSDLMMGLFAGTGDSSRIVIAPTSLEECHYYVAEAFYLAEKYQMPVIVMIDLFLSTCKSNLVLKKIDSKKLDVNKKPTKEQLKDYKRFKVTSDGVSPRTIPGIIGGEFVASGLEQDEDGNTSYYGIVHTKMSEKRYRKLQIALEEDIPKPIRFGSKGRVKLGILSWGSSMGSAVEAVEKANEMGYKVAALKQIVINPIHLKEVKSFCNDCEKLMVPELNFSGQFANWLSMHIDRDIHRYSKVLSRPLTYMDILDEIERLLKGKK